MHGIYPEMGRLCWPPRVLSTRGFRVLLIAVALLAPSSRASAELCLAVDYRFSGPESSRVLVGSMEQEVSSIWNSYGVRVWWVTRSAQPVCERVDGSFDVAISDRRHAYGLPKKVVLGRSHLALASIVHIPVAIDYHAVVQILGLMSNEHMLRLAGHPNPDARDIGRALGRVLAHEIGHVLLDVQGHQPHGLMRRVFQPAELVIPQRSLFTLSAAELDRLHEREAELTGLERAADPPAMASRE